MASGVEEVSALSCHLTVLEFDRKQNTLRDELLHQTFTLTNRRIAVPNQPGLGVTVREATLERFTAHLHERL